MSTDLWAAPDIVPSIKYNDLARAIDWLTNVFQFRERRGSRLSWPGGGMTWIEVGNGLLNISTPDPTWDQAAGTEQTSFVMKVYVDDVDAHFVHAKAHGAAIVSEPEEGFWGGRIYRVRDHEGNQWEISQRGRDLAAEKWKLPPGVTRK